MNELEKFALLKDLALLIRKYGPDVFAELAQFLRDPTGLLDLVKILEASEVAAHRSRARPVVAERVGQRSAKGGVRQWLLKLHKDEPEKAELLRSFFDALAAKRALRTIREMRSFAEDAGLKPLSAKSRDKAIVPLLRDLSGRPLDDLRSLLARARKQDTTGDRTLEGWANVILSKRPSR